MPVLPQGLTQTNEQAPPWWRPSRPPTASRNLWWSLGAGMLSAANLTALDKARLRFIVGARTTRAPGDLEAHFHWEGDAPADGQVIDTITPRRGSRSERDKSLKAEPVWDPGTHPGSWRAVWVYSKRRAARDNQTLTAQEGRARAIRRRREASQGHAFCPPSTPVTPPWMRPPWPEPGPWSASRATSPFVPSRLMNAAVVVSSYHELWHARAVLFG